MADSETSEEYSEHYKKKGNGNGKALSHFKKTVGKDGDSSKPTTTEVILWVEKEATEEHFRVEQKLEQERKKRRENEGKADKREIHLNNFKLKITRELKFQKRVNLLCCSMLLAMTVDRGLVGMPESEILQSVKSKQEAVAVELKATEQLIPEFQHFKEIVRKDLISTSNLTHQSIQQVERFSKKMNSIDGLKVTNGYKENENLSTLRAAYHASQEELKFLRFEVRDLKRQFEEQRKTNE